MAGFRTTFFAGAGRLSTAIPLSWLRALSGQRLVMPLYHLVSDAPVPHVQHLYPIKNTRDFEADLDFFLRHYRPVSLPQLIQHAQHGEALPQNAFFLSFDDGLREFHDVIAPLLLKKGVPGTCFLNSDFVDNRGLFFRYAVSLALDSLVKTPDLANMPAAVRWTHGQGKRNLRKALLEISYENRAAVTEILEVLGVDEQAYLREAQPYLTSPQIKMLLDQGFHFGAHSCDHPEYRHLTVAEQLVQTATSIGQIQEQFDLSYRAFAFPFTDHGVGRPFFESMLGKEALADISFGCAGMKTEAFARHYQRIPMENSGLSACHTIKTEYLYHLLRKPFGRNTISRN